MTIDVPDNLYCIYKTLQIISTNVLKAANGSRECYYECFKLPHNLPTTPPPPSHNVTTDPTHPVGHIVSYRSLVGIIRVAFPFLLVMKNYLH